jgi:hypothetical protein
MYPLEEGKPMRTADSSRQIPVNIGKYRQIAVGKETPPLAGLFPRTAQNLHSGSELFTTPAQAD